MTADRVPDGWREVSLEREAYFQSGFAFKSEDFCALKESSLPLIRIRDLKRQSPEIYVSTELDERYRVKNGDCLVGMDGEFTAVRWWGGEAALNQRVLKFESAGECLDTDFLFYRLQPELRKLELTISGTTVKHLSTKHLKQLKILLPPSRNNAVSPKSCPAWTTPSPRRRRSSSRPGRSSRPC